MIYFKQYGVQRSGTNYLKRLMELNFKDTTVFGSVLGWKHGMYETANSDAEKFRSRSHDNWIDKKTKDGKVYSVDNHVLKYTPEELRKACRNLNYLISIKDPHAYIMSFKKFRARKQPWDPKKVKTWLDNYFTCYLRWSNIVRAYPKRCTVVKYEELLENKAGVLAEIRDKFGLTQKHEEFVNEVKVVRASTDHGLMIDGKNSFDPNYYLNKKYLEEMPESIVNLVTRLSEGTKVRI